MVASRRHFFDQTASQVTRLLICVMLFAAGAVVDAATVRMRIIATSDVHAQIYNYDYYTDTFVDDYGFSKTAQLIRESRAEAKNSLLIDDGDLLQGTPLIEYYINQHKIDPAVLNPVIRVFNLMDYDAVNLGNHEFNYGMSYLRDAIAQARFPVICANVYQVSKSNSPLIRQNVFKPYVILAKNWLSEEGQPVTLRIAILGVLPPQVMAWDRSNLPANYVVDDMLQSVQHYLPEIKAQNPDLIIVAAHSGFGREYPEQNAENALYAISKIDGIDALIGGHVHKNFPVTSAKDPREPLPNIDFERGIVNGKPTVIPGYWGDHVGVIDLTLRGDSGHWKTLQGTAKLLSVAHDLKNKPNSSLLSGDDKVIKEISAVHTGTIAYLKKPIGKLTAPLNSYFSLIHDDAAVALIAEAQMWYANKALIGTSYQGWPLLSVAAPFRGPEAKSPLDIREGTMSMRDIAALYVYRNTVTVLKVTGADVRNWLEMGAGAFNTINPGSDKPQQLLNPEFVSYNFDVIFGVNYRIDVRQPPRFDLTGKIINAGSHRIKDLTYQGRPVVDADKFLAVTSSYRAAGGGHFPGIEASKIVQEYTVENREAIAEFIADKGTACDLSNHHWRFEPFTTKQPVVFQSSKLGREFAAQIPGLSWHEGWVEGWREWVARIPGLAWLNKSAHSLTEYQLDFSKQ